MVNIIAEKYKDFKKFYPENKNNFLEAKPFPYIELNNFFNEDYLNQILDNFPKMSENKHDFKRNTKAEVKLGIGSPEKIPKKINLFIEYLNSYFFLDFLQKLTGIKQRLIPDPYLFGAGLHEIKKGGFLKIHSDFNVHPQLNLNRRLNLLLYLNKDWKEEWGGHLELWDRDMKSCKVKISPNFNKLVSSLVFPEFEITTKMSFLSICPASPCETPVGSTKKLGMPTLENVAAAFLQIKEFFPTPEKITLPRQFIIRSIA